MRSELPCRNNVRVFADLNELSLHAAEAVVRAMNAAIGANGRASIALSGGSTPRTLHRLLATQFLEQIPWGKVHIFWGDERFVPYDDPRSNFRMARETLLDSIPCPSENVHPMPTGIPDPDSAALDYDRTLKNYFSEDWPPFDLVLLGLGKEGHTASLFPNSSALKEASRWVVAVNVPAEPRQRLTLTMPAIIHAANIHVLVAGSDKADALHKVLDGRPDLNNYPASGLRQASDRVVWWVDREAAALLKESADRSD